MNTYTVLFAKSVLAFIDEHVVSERVFARIEAYEDLLASYPYLGSVYDPEYEAARPPIPCRHISIPDTPFTLYYVVDDERQTVTVFYIDFAAANPTERFRYLER